jgi:hypothetical protein
MSTIGKNLSFVKRKLAQERTPNVISRTVVYMHQATSFSTLIDLNSLNLPSEAAANGFANPGLDNIPFLVLFRQNVKIESSYKGELVDYQDYIITNNTQINLLSPNTTEPGEIFVITLNLPNNVDVKSLLDNLNTPLFSLNQALYGVNSLLKFSDSDLGTQVLSILSYVTDKNKKENNAPSQVVFDVSGFPGADSFLGGVLLPDGRVFCVPLSATNARIYDPVTNTISVAGITGGSAAFVGGVLLPDGRVFCVPLNASNGKIYDPVTDTQSNTALTGGSGAFRGGVLLPDGRVFCVPLDASNAKIYDPVTNTQSTTALTGGVSAAFAGGVLLPDGRVFCVPLNASNGKIYEASKRDLPMEYVLSPFFNKY